MAGKVHRRGTAHQVKRLRHANKRPCRSAPAAPTGLAVEFLKREVHHREEWRARVTFNAVTLDVAGRPLDVERYDVQLRATDASGVPITIAGHDDDVQRESVNGNDSPLKAVFENLSRPKTWYYQARVRTLNRVHGGKCWSAWTSWTTATQPASGALPGPPAPTGVSLRLDKVEGTRRFPWRASPKWNEIGTWTPTNGDPIDGVATYQVQLAVSKDGGTNTINVRRASHPADPTGTVTHVDFFNARGRRHYRARVRAVDQYGRIGAYSSWTAWASPGGTPASVENLTWSNPTPGTLVARWDSPADPTDVDRFNVKVYRQPGLVLVDEGESGGTRYTYHIPPADRDNNHRVVVTTLEEEASLDVDDDVSVGFDVPDAAPEETSSDVANDEVWGPGDLDLPAIADEVAIILPPPSDGDPPDAVTGVTLVGGPGFLFVKWPVATGTTDIVTYDVHISTSSGFTPGPTNLLTSGAVTFGFIKSLADGTALAYGTTYYVKIVARDVDGTAAASSQVSATMTKTVTADIAANAVTVAELADNAVTQAKLADAAVGSAEMADLAVTTAKVAALAISTAKIAADAITAAQLADDAVGAEHIQALAVTSAEVAANAITTAKLAADAVTAAQLADDAVGSEHIQALAVTSAELAALSVTTAKIAADAVTAGEIAANAVGSTEIAALAVTSAKIAANAVRTSELAADAVTAAQLADDAVGSEHIQALAVTASEVASNAITTVKIIDDAINSAKIATDAVGTTEIAALAITAAKIAANTITAAKIAADTITAAEIAALAITTSELAAGAVTAAKIAADTITANEIAASAITTSELAAGSVTAAKIVADTITAAEIAALAITTSELAAGAVTAAKIAAGTITANEIAANTITAAKIAADTITATEIAANAITTSELNALAVTAAKIAANTITAAQIAAGTITATEIAAATITAAKIAADTITANEIAANAVTTSELNALAVTAAKIATGTITATQIAAGTITATEIAALTITAAKIAANTITAAQIAADTITASQIAADAITATELAANAVTTAKILAGQVTAVKIAADTITASEIAASAITTAELAASAVTAAKIAAGTITATQIAAGTITSNEIAAETITAFTAIIANAAIGDALISSLSAEKIIGGALTGEFELQGFISIPTVAGALSPQDGVQGVIVDANGIRVYSSNGILVGNWPAQGTDLPSMTGAFVASTMEINDGFSYKDADGRMEVNSGLNLQSGVQAPGAAPVVTQDMAQEAAFGTTLTIGASANVTAYTGHVVQYDGICYEPSGTGSVETFYAIPYVSESVTCGAYTLKQPLYLVEVTKSSGAIARVAATSLDEAIYLDGIRPDGGYSNYVDLGVTRCGNYIHILVTYEVSGGTRTRIYTWNKTTFAYVGCSEQLDPDIGAGYASWISRDQESSPSTAVPVIMLQQSDDDLKPIKYASVAPGASPYTLGAVTQVFTAASANRASPNLYVWGGIFDGTYWWVVWANGNGKNAIVRRHATDGSVSTTYDFTNPSGDMFGGLTYKPTGTLLYTQTSANTVYKAEAESWNVTSGGVVWKVAYEWWNNSLYTTRSPCSTIAMNNRWRMTVTIGQYPTGGTGSWKAYIYALYSATDPSAGAMKSQANITSPTTSKVVTAYASGGAADHTTNGLAGIGAAAFIAPAVSTHAKLQGSGDGFLPVGAIAMFGGSSAPVGWALCDGSSVLRTGTYAALFAIIGTTYGSVDGTHFTLPDMRSRFPMGTGTFAALGVGDANAESARTPRHTHGLSGQTGTDTGTARAVGTGASNASDKGHTHGVSAASPTSNSSGDAISYLSVNFIIKL